MLSHGYELLQWPLDVDIVRCKPSVPWICTDAWLRDARTAAQERKRHDRGGDVLISVTRRTCTGTASCSCSTCVITTQLCTHAVAVPYAVQELFRSVALLYAPLLPWRVRQIAALRLTICSRTSGTTRDREGDGKAAPSLGCTRLLMLLVPSKRSGAFI